MNAPHSNPAIPAPAPAVIFGGIEKSFFGIKVVRGVDFEVGARRILGLVGENGAGKSTLMNLLGGNLQPDSGTFSVHGRPYSPRSPKDARAAGIAFVHQELNLFPNLSIAENLFLTDLPRVRDGVPWIRRSELRRRAVDLLSQVGLNHSPGTLVESLTAGERQLVEIAKALAAQARVIILDEPTTSLSSRECERLFTLLRQVRGRGIALIYISHTLGDILRLCDDIVVLRDGGLVGQGPVGEFTHDRLVSLMVGRQLNQLYPTRDLNAARTAPVLQVLSVGQPGIVREVSFDLAAGEVLGISGLMGAGRSELARILFGLDSHTAGEIRLEGRPLVGSPRERIRQGLAFLTEDRRSEGLCMEASIADNMSLATLGRHARQPLGWLDFAGIRDAVGRMREAVQLSAKAGDAQPVRTLSGGNQQKVVLGKWLLAEPKVLILDEPTRGIDVGARFEIYQLIHQLADRGAGVLVISSEIEELMGLCDRILVMRRGEITAGFAREQFDREQILAASLQASTS
jgi:ABC-type sugar transport system ATPase subunit